MTEQSLPNRQIKPEEPTQLRGGSKQAEITLNHLNTRLVKGKRYPWLNLGLPEPFCARAYQYTSSLRRPLTTNISINDLTKARGKFSC